MNNQAAQTMPSITTLPFVTVEQVQRYRAESLRVEAHRNELLNQVAALSQTAGVAEGWKLVPIEPNWDMRNEGREFLIDGLHKEPEKLAYFLWKTMVAAAPEVE